MELTFSCFCKFDAKGFVGPKLNEHFTSGCGLNSLLSHITYYLDVIQINQSIIMWVMTNRPFKFVLDT